MLEIRKTSITLDETDIMQLEMIITDLDEKEALQYLKKAVYSKVKQMQGGKLKSHLDGDNNPADKFKKDNL